MAHHKRKGPKSTRAGCLLCKPQKRQGASRADRQRFSQTRNLKIARERIAETRRAPTERDAPGGARPV